MDSREELKACEEDVRKAVEEVREKLQREMASRGSPVSEEEFLRMFKGKLGDQDADIDWGSARIAIGRKAATRSRFW